MINQFQADDEADSNDVDKVSVLFLALYSTFCVNTHKSCYYFTQFYDREEEEYDSSDHFEHEFWYIL